MLSSTRNAIKSRLLLAATTTSTTITPINSTTTSVQNRLLLQLSHQQQRRRIIQQQQPKFQSSVAAQQLSTFDDDDDEYNDSFEILGLPRQFQLSPNELKRSYRSLMTKYHPDKHSHPASNDDTIDNIDNIDLMASKVTNAYQILKDPHTRATHLLELVGSPIDETSHTDLVGAEFLMEVMEIFEDVETTHPKYLKPIWEETKVRTAQIVDDFQKAFDEEQNYTKAMELAAKLQYWRRIHTAIHEKMDLEEAQGEATIVAEKEDNEEPSK